MGLPEIGMMVAVVGPWLLLNAIINRINELEKDIRNLENNFEDNDGGICDMCNQEIQTQKREDWLKSGE